MATDIQNSAEEDAQRIFENIWWPLRSTRPFPVDPIKIARSLGIDVYMTDLESEVSGALVKDVGQDPVILLNNTDSANRQRFSCAHELGHFTRRSNDVDQFSYVDYRNMLSTTGTDSDEIYANRFGASLLMPASEVKRLRRLKKTVIEMASHFDVSKDTMVFRLKGLGLLAAAA